MQQLWREEIASYSLLELRLLSGQRDHKQRIKIISLLLISLNLKNHLISGFFVVIDFPRVLFGALNLIWPLRFPDVGIGPLLSANFRAIIAGKNLTRSISSQ
jgi:hypothetical protein